MKSKVFTNVLVPTLCVTVGPTGLGQVQVYEISGTGGEYLGWSLALVGDLDGDQVDDFAAGAVHGPERVLLCSGVDGSLIRELPSPVPDSSFGNVVAAAEDVNADGVGDVLVGAPYSGTNAGAVYVYSGADGALLHALASPADFALFGAALAGLGDLDGDGHGDFAVGAPGGSTVSGRVYVHSGIDGSLLWSAAAPSGGFVEFGHALAALDDLDGDGRRELAVGAPDAGAHGAAYVLSGAAGAQLYADDAGPGDRVGWSVADAGDVDGDGLGDWMVGAPAGTGAVPTVRLRSGADGALLHQWNSAGLYNGFGRYIDGAGDVNADGVPDLWIAQPGANIAPEKLWLVDGASLEIVLGIEDQTYTYISIAGGSDLTGDGAADLLHGRPLAPPQPLDGKVTLWSVGCEADPFQSYCSSAPNSAGAGALMDHSGSSSVTADDLRLETAGCPPGQLGLYFFGADAISLPFGDGFRCVAAPVFRLGPPVSTGAGTASRLLDIEHLPSDAPGILAGSHWRFQFWYRDPGFGSFGFNLSDGLAVGFCP